MSPGTYTLSFSGGPRRSAFYYDLWNIKYLPKFKWDHLTEEIGARACELSLVHCVQPTSVR